jgi:ribosome-binding ATPase YchF (GTP1/OBG family)
MKVGIVGLPNAGKSTLFNALTKGGAQTGDYPFTTIEPNVAIAQVPDERLQRVGETVGSSELVPATISAATPTVASRTPTAESTRWPTSRRSRPS